MIKFTSEDIFLVTGSSSGIGKSVALKLNELGSKVIAVSRSPEALKVLQNTSAYPHNFFFEIINLSSEIEKLSERVLELSSRYGRLRGIVLSAGEQQILPLRSLTPKKAKELFDINYFANIALCKGFCDRRAHREKDSSVVFISSIASVTGNAGIINYSASKGAINSAVKALAVELAKDNIRVNAVLPGFVKTGIIDKWRDIYTHEYLEQLEKEYPLGIGQPEYVADLVVFLLSDCSRWITGGNIIIDGGASL